MMAMVFVCFRTPPPRGLCVPGELGEKTTCSSVPIPGASAASFYTLIGTAKLNRLDPSLYLRPFLARIAEHPINLIGELLPWNLTAALHSDPAEAA
jgi:hypothetical protein